MPVIIGRARKSRLAKTTVRVPRKRVPGQPGLEPIGAPLTRREREVAAAFSEALTFTPEQIAAILDPDAATDPMRRMMEHLEPARVALSEALQDQIDDSGALFWNELTDQLTRKPDPSAINLIRKDISTNPVTLTPPVGASFSVDFSKRTPTGKRWADNQSARLITNVSEDSMANLRDVIGGTTGRGGRQPMMNLLGEVLEATPSMGDLAEFGDRLAPSVAGLTMPQHNAVLNRSRTVFGDAIGAGKTVDQAMDAVEAEASKYGKKLRQQRGRAISRTEMMEAANRGKLEAAQQAAANGMFDPKRAGKQWITSSFDVCFVCAPLHGKVVAFQGGEFKPTVQRSGEWVVELRELPPAHPNCRCTWTTVYDTIVPPSTTAPGQVIAPPDIPMAVRDQSWTEAAKIRKRVAPVQNSITESVVGASEDLGAEMAGLQFRVKEEASLARKIAADFTDDMWKKPLLTVQEVADDVGDALRYTMLLDEDDYVDGVSRAIRDFHERGYELKKPPKNYWQVDNVDNPYNGINVNFRAPDGTVIEVQFHTPASFEMKQGLHPLYEESRQVGVTNIRAEQLRLQMQVASDTLEHPEQVTDLRYFAEESNAYRLQTDDDLYNRFGGRLPNGTQDAYMDPETGKWWELRSDLHDDIVADMMGDVAPVENPTTHFMGGGPASGKGGLIKRGLVDFDETTMVKVDADEIKKMLPEYKVLSQERATLAAAYVHEESSDLAKRAFAESIGSGRNTVLDGTGDSSIAKLRAKVAAAREATPSGRVTADYVTIDTDTAVARARSRGSRTGRFVPEEVVRDTHESISRIFPDILDEQLFDDVRLFDTAFDPPKLILQQIEGVTEVLDEEAYLRFLAKNPDFVPPTPDLGVTVSPFDLPSEGVKLDEIAVAWQAQSREALEEMIERKPAMSLSYVQDKWSAPGLGSSATLDDALADPTRVRYRVKVDPTDPDKSIAVNTAVEDLRRARGFDALPELVSDAELDEVLESGGLELIRGDEQIEFLEQLQSGDFYTGTGHYGDGTYFFSNSGATSAERGLRTLGDGDTLDTVVEMAQSYAKGWTSADAGAAVRAALRPDASTISGKDLALVEQALGAQAEEIVKMAHRGSIDDAGTAAVERLRSLRSESVEDFADRIPNLASRIDPASRESIETVGELLDRLGYTGDDPFGLIALAKQSADPIEDPAFQSIYRLVVNDRTDVVKVGRTDDGAVATLLGYDAVVDTLAAAHDYPYRTQVLLLNRDALVVVDELISRDEMAKINDMIRAARVTQDTSPEVLDFTLTDIRQRVAAYSPLPDVDEIPLTPGEVFKLPKDYRVDPTIVQATKPEQWFDEAESVEEVLRDISWGDNRLDWNDPKVSNDPALRRIIKTQWPEAQPMQLTLTELEAAIAEGQTVIYRGIGADDASTLEGYVQNFMAGGDTDFVGQGLFGNGTYATDAADIAEDFSRNKWGTGSGGVGEWETGTVLEMVIDPDAKIALYDPLLEEMMEAGKPVTERIAEIGRTELSVREAAQRYDDISLETLDFRWGRDMYDDADGRPLFVMEQEYGLDHPWFSEPKVKEAIAELKRLEDKRDLLYTDVGRYAASVGVDVIEVAKPILPMGTEVPGSYYVILNRSAVGVGI